MSAAVVAILFLRLRKHRNIPLLAVFGIRGQCFGLVG